VFLIGACGGPSCGKTTLVEYIKISLGKTIACIKCSDFYRPLLGDLEKQKSTSSDFTKQLKDINGAGDENLKLEKINKEYDFDSPDAIEFDLLVEGLKLLKKSVPFTMPKYNKKTKKREEKWVTVEPCDVVIVEGHLIFADKDLRDMFDLKIYIDADDDVRLSRRILKEKNEAEKDGDFDVIKCLDKYEKFVKPAHEKYVEPTKKFADIVIPNYGFTIEELNLEKQFVCKPALDLIIKEIKTRTGFE
jgi:uridine kinase